MDDTSFFFSWSNCPTSVKNEFVEFIEFIDRFCTRKNRFVTKTTKDRSLKDLESLMIQNQHDIVNHYSAELRRDASRDVSGF